MLPAGCSAAKPPLETLPMTHVDVKFWTSAGKQKAREANPLVCFSSLASEIFFPAGWLQCRM